MTKTTTNSKLTVKAVNSANVRIDNSSDADRTLDLSADVNISGTAVTSLDGQIASREGAQAGSFNAYGEENLSVNFYGIAAEERCAALAGVQQFIADIREQAGQLAVFNV